MNWQKMPPGFLWGTATSAHQVEGGNIHNDWWDFEQDSKRSGAASDFRNRFESDLDLARDLGTNSFRLSLEWSRIEPKHGQRCPMAIDYYHQLIDACLDKDLQPFVTLQQFTLPRWCADKGGWLNQETLTAFNKHVSWVADQFGDRVSHFVTINEPNVQAGASYLAGVFPPGRRLRPDLADRCQAALIKAHAQAYRTIHNNLEKRFPGRSVELGVSPHIVSWKKSHWDLGGIFKRIGEQFNWGFLDALSSGTIKFQTYREVAPEIQGCFDFVGMNYFMGMPANILGVLKFMGLIPKSSGEQSSDNGWPQDAPGFEQALLRAHNDYHKPIYVTENGIADASDRRRSKYLTDHLEALSRASGAGVDIRGYFHWSLMDNFEWHEGLQPRFGLYEVDYDSQERRPRRSAELYKGLIQKYSESYSKVGDHEL
ncbi:MAG: family 1 glycosylhydrolase [Planctomycetota bacterium]|nr:family 1 glycosylhydrolase [Planctomycetota bacterium]